MQVAALLAALALAAEPTSVPVDTADGATVQLIHHEGRGAPVLLIHGLSANHRTWDLRDRGLAHTLQDAGYDVWLLDLRGRLGSAPPQGQRGGWTLDDYGRYDVHAAISHVSAQSGHDRVAVVGHSMGGMVMAVHHHWHGDDQVGPVVILGSPIQFTHPDPMVKASLRTMSVGETIPRIPTRAATWTAALFPKMRRIDAMVTDPEGMDAPTRRAMYRRVVSPMSSGEMDHLKRIIQSGRLVSLDGEVDYVDSLGSWTPPLLVVAGRTDRVAPPDRVVTWIDAAGGSDETWWVAGKGRGYPHEYGHLDLVLADTVETHLHAELVDWLQARSW